MKHTAIITPLNCVFSPTLMGMIKMELSEYNAAADRMIYCKSPDISWFRMKAPLSSTPFLEPTFYGVRVGDVIEIEFSALAMSGSPQMRLPVLMVNADYTTTQIAVFNATDSLKSHFKKYKIRYVIPSNFSGIGILLNLRPNSAVNEVVLKDLVFTIDTENPLFSIANNVVKYETRTDYMKCIDYVSGTNLNTAYNSLLNVYNAGHVLFPDDATLQFTSAGTVDFKGLLAMFNGHKYRPIFATYAEYICPTTVFASNKKIAEDGTLTAEVAGSFPPSASIRKAIVYSTGATEVTRKTIMDLGMISTGGELTLKNVRFSMPQFDDSVKRPPNQLEELYTNLRLKLR